MHNDTKYRRDATWQVFCSIIYEQSQCKCKEEDRTYRHINISTTLFHIQYMNICNKYTINKIEHCMNAHCTDKLCFVVKVCLKKKPPMNGINLYRNKRRFIYICSMFICLQFNLNQVIDSFRKICSGLFFKYHQVY